MFEILRRDEMANGTVVLNEISAQKIAAKARPGQFVILKANETGERIPLTMADADPKKGTITIIYQVVGKSTALFKSLQVGERFQDVIGPLGQAPDTDHKACYACADFAVDEDLSGPESLELAEHEAAQAADGGDNPG